ncbi:MAG: hypothetical protein KAR19_00005 [Bacteroidales bacterium]|nr:hypothetical protein [Bacteroidales bacterium]
MFPVNSPLPKSDYWGPKDATRIVFYDTNPDEIRRKIINIIIVLNFLNRNFKLLQWTFDNALSGKHLERFEKHVESLKEYVNQNFKKPQREPDWYYVVDYWKFPLYELTPNPTRIDFGKCLWMYVELSDAEPIQKRIKELIDFFSYSSLSNMIMSKVYDNSNLQVSNSFVIIESLAMMDITDQSGFKICQHCGERINANRPIMDIVEEFIETRIKDKELQGVVLDILKKHYRTRNRFLHAAKFDRSIDLIDRTIEKTGSNHIKLSDEIELGGAADMGLKGINSYLRLELLDRLGYKSFD